MDLNTAAYEELITLSNIGEVRATTVVAVREKIGRSLTLLDLTLDCGISGDIVKHLVESGEIQSVPRHEDSGKSEQAATLLMSISESIQTLSEAVDKVNNRQTLFESVLKAAGVNVSGASDAHPISQIDTKESMAIPRQDSEQDQKTGTQSMTISRQDSVHNADGAEVAHHQNDLKDVVNDSDDEDAKLERRLRLIRQSNLSGVEQGRLVRQPSNNVGETLHVCHCSGTNSRVMLHPELNKIPGPRSSPRPGPNQVDFESSNSRLIRHPELSRPRSSPRPGQSQPDFEGFSPSGSSRSSKADWYRWSKIRVPEFKDNRNSWHSYIIQFNTIMKMNDCNNSEVMVCKLVEALRGTALDYFESLPQELRLEFVTLCNLFEGRFGRQEVPATMRSKLKCIAQRVEELLAEFAERTLKVASEGYSGMTGQWVQVLAVDAFLMGCSDKRSALSAMDKEPQTVDEAVKLMRRFNSHEKALGTEKKVRTLTSEDAASASLQVNRVEASTGSTNAIDVSQLNESIKMLTQLLAKQNTSPRPPGQNARFNAQRTKNFVCFSCGEGGHIARNCPKSVPEEEKMAKPAKDKKNW